MSAGNASEELSFHLQGNFAPVHEEETAFDLEVEGTIPPELGNLANLQYMYLHANQLTGTIPPGLGDLSSLQRLWLYSNQLTGTIPPT